MAVELQGKTSYYWCSCGYTSNGAFCDGAHKQMEGGKKSLAFTPIKTGTYILCGCKATKTPPYCDGSHAR